MADPESDPEARGGGPGGNGGRSGRARTGGVHLIRGATVVALAAVIGAWVDRPRAAVALSAFVAVLGLLSVIDARHHRLPNRIVGPLALAAVLVVGLDGVTGGGMVRVGRSLATGAALAALFLVVSLVGQLGLGDVKLAFPLGVVLGWLGSGAVAAMALGTLVSSGMVAVALLVSGGSRHDTIPFGPFLALGTVVAIVAAGLG